MEKEVLKEPNYVEELLDIIRSDLSDEEKKDRLSDYHENDIADALEELTPEERQEIYKILGPDRVAEIFAYLENVDVYLNELKLEHAANLVSRMDSDDAVDVLEEVDDETRDKLVEMMDDESSRDVKLIQSYDDDEVGSVMTTNFIVIKCGLTIRQAMRELVKQAGENPYEKALRRYSVGNRYVGTVSMVDTTGFFVALDGGIDCLCSYPKRGRPPRGARVTIRILGINHETNRIWGAITHVATPR